MTSKRDIEHLDRRMTDRAEFELEHEDKDIRPPDHEERMNQARAHARWYLGSGSWADDLVGAYLWPNADKAHLVKAKSKYDYLR